MPHTTAPADVIPSHSEHERMVLSLLSPRESVSLDEILERAVGISWSQVFLALDRLSRRGEVLLTRRGFVYRVQLHTPREHSGCASPGERKTPAATPAGQTGNEAKACVA